MSLVSTIKKLEECVQASNEKIAELENMIQGKDAIIATIEAAKSEAVSACEAKIKDSQADIEKAKAESVNAIQEVALKSAELDSVRAALESAEKALKEPAYVHAGTNDVDASSIIPLEASGDESKKESFLQAYDKITDPMERAKYRKEHLKEMQNEFNAKMQEEK